MPHITGACNSGHPAVGRQYIINIMAPNPNKKFAGLKLEMKIGHGNPTTVLCIEKNGLDFKK